jgi:mevalonate kinase
MKFYSKVLLFGEHIVNKGAKALAVPYSAFYCTLTFDTTVSHILPESETILKSIHKHIETLPDLAQIFDLERFYADIEQGLKIEMNVPIGYGLGSSGALVACIYETYCQKKINDASNLKTQLGEIESVFHGKSSGLDPLVSYLNKAVLIDGNSRIIDSLQVPENHFKVFLVDTHLPRKTAPLVNAFLQKCDSDSSFFEVVSDQIVPLNNQIVDAYVDGNFDGLYEKIKQLSMLQLEHFGMLILPQHKAIWQQGISENQFFLKVCGAGGGGFMLAFCKNEEALFKAFSAQDLMPVQA